MDIMPVFTQIDYSLKSRGTRFLSQDIKIAKAIEELKSSLHKQEKKKVVDIVVLGTGWAAIHFIRNLQPLKHQEYRIQVISPRPYFTFQPLLPSVVGRALEAECARTEIWSLLPTGEDTPVKYHQASAENVNVDQKEVRTDDGKTFNYDYLIYAIGTTNNTFGIPGVDDHAYFLKDWTDAVRFGTRIKSVLDEAQDMVKNGMVKEDELTSKLHFVICGAGPTGTEVTAEMVDLITDSYPELESYVSLTLVDMMDRVLPSFSSRTSGVALSKLSSSPMVHVLLGCAFEGCTEDTISLRMKKNDASDIPDAIQSLIIEKSDHGGTNSCVKLRANTLLWTSGVTQWPITKDLIEYQSSKGTLNGQEPQGRPPPGVLVDSCLHAHHLDGVYVLGDNAIIKPSMLAPRLDEIIDFGKSNQMVHLEVVLGALRPFYPQIPHKQMKRQTLLTDRNSCFERLSLLDQGACSPAPTAQNATQQGSYLGASFHEYGVSTFIRPSFRFKYRGSMCYLGNDRAILEIDKDGRNGLYGSWGSGIVWRAYYGLAQKTVPKKMAVLTNFGRNWIHRKLPSLY